MRDIYLIDFENVASEGLSGITYLSEDDQVIIFYSNNSNRLTMKMHILIGKSVCQLSYFEVTVGGKNALDHQISTWLGYLMGTGAAERNYYIVSRDMGYKHVANFWNGNQLGPKVRCIDAIKGASRLERNRREAAALQDVPQQPEAQTAQDEPAVPDAPAAEIPAMEIAAPSPEEMSAPVSVAEESPAAETPVEEVLPAEVPVAAEPAETETTGQKNNYRNRGRTRNRSRGKKPQEAAEIAPVQDVQESAAPNIAEAAPQPEAPVEEKQQKPSQKNGQNKSKAPANTDQLSALIAPYPKLQENVLRDLIANNKRQILCNTLRKHLGQEKGLALYNEIKRMAWH